MSLMSVIRCLFIRRVLTAPAAEALLNPSPASLEPDERDMWPELVRLDREATERLLTVQRLRNQIEIQTRRQEQRRNA